MFEPVLTKNVGNPDALTLKGYKKTGGYDALAKALKMECTAEGVEAMAERALVWGTTRRTRRRSRNGSCRAERPP